MEPKLFIFAQRRSGSTLLQRLLNSLNNVVIYGEHIGVLKGIAESYRGFLYHRNRSHFECTDPASVLPQLRDASTFIATTCGLSVTDYKQEFGKLVSYLINPLKVQNALIGFKEIHYGIDNDYVFEMLRELYPNSKFIFLVRNPLDQITSAIRSGYWRLSEDEAISQWKNQAQRFNKYRQAAPDQTRILSYEQLIADDDRERVLLFRWLGYEWTSEQHRILFQLGKVGITRNRTPLSESTVQRITAECNVRFLEANEQSSFKDS